MVRSRQRALPFGIETATNCLRVKAIKFSSRQNTHITVISLKENTARDTRKERTRVKADSADTSLFDKVHDSKPGTGPGQRAAARAQRIRGPRASAASEGAVSPCTTRLTFTEGFGEGGNGARNCPPDQRHLMLKDKAQQPPPRRPTVGRLSLGAVAGPCGVTLTVPRTPFPWTKCSTKLRPGHRRPVLV